MAAPGEGIPEHPAEDIGQPQVPAEVIELEELESRHKQAEEHRRMLEQRRREIQRKHADRERELRLLEGLDAFCIMSVDPFRIPRLK
jgi:hypothetical protein